MSGICINAFGIFPLRVWSVQTSANDGAKLARFQSLSLCNGLHEWLSIPFANEESLHPDCEVQNKVEGGWKDGTV